MEHYDWNDGWLFAPTFDPAIVRPECTGVELALQHPEIGEAFRAYLKEFCKTL